ncbi:MAG: type II toxin-antitoxin system toxin DNA ADP-ribosyl transferase DarT [Candidatus Limnocylindria bacterium]
MPHPVPTLIYRFVHVSNLPVLLARAALHAPLHAPEDGLVYRTIHNVDIQDQRRRTEIPCGPGGVVHDYVAFYFGPRSPMLLQLHTGRVDGYDETQEPIIYLISTAQAIRDSGAPYVFSDGHGIALFTDWFDDLGELDRVDWTAVSARYWVDTVDEPDRQRRKQSEFLVYKSCPWELISELAVLNQHMKNRVQTIMADFPAALRRQVRIRPELYY